MWRRSEVMLYLISIRNWILLPVALERLFRYIRMCRSISNAWEETKNQIGLEGQDRRKRFLPSYKSFFLDSMWSTDWHLFKFSRQLYSTVFPFSFLFLSSSSRPELSITGSLKSAGSMASSAGSAMVAGIQRVGEKVRALSGKIWRKK